MSYYYPFGKEVQTMAHPRQIGALGAHSEKWNQAHSYWEQQQT